jgi:hypothetical protein
VPDPASTEPVRKPYPVVSPYSKNQVVARPLGFSEPPTLAERVPIPNGAPVAAVGGPGVAKEASAPTSVAAELWATNR